MIDVHDIEIAEQILHIAGWNDIHRHYHGCGENRTDITANAMYSICGRSPFCMFPAGPLWNPQPIQYKTSFFNLQQVVDVARNTPLIYHRGGIDALIDGNIVNTECGAHSINNPVNAIQQVTEGVTTWYGTLARILRQHANSPSVIEYIADSLDGGGE